MELPFIIAGEDVVPSVGCTVNASIDVKNLLLGVCWVVTSSGFVISTKDCVGLGVADIRSILVITTRICSSILVRRLQALHRVRNVFIISVQGKDKNRNSMSFVWFRTIEKCREINGK